MSVNLVPAARFTHESWVKNSRFIASIAPAFSVTEARSFITEISQEYPDATHHVPAYIIGFGPATIDHASDDGEPSGTAGKPALAVLKGSGLGDAVLVITRYFGGTKLGTGGLVKAYSNAARSAVEQVPKAAKITTHRIGLACHYSLYEQMLRLIELHEGFKIEEDFSERVSLEFSIPSSALDGFSSAAMNLTNGSININILHENQPALKLFKNK